MADGSLHVVFGSPGAGKTHYVLHEVIPRHVGRGRFVVYATSEADDSRAFKWGPVVRDVRELDGEHCPEAVCVLGEAAPSRAAALELGSRVREALGYRTLVVVDEAHELWPEPSPRGAVESFHTVRHRSGLTIVAITQWPAKLSKVLYRTALAVGSVTWFRVDTSRDLAWIREECGAEGALLVAELPKYRPIVVRAGEVPEAFRGYVAKLRREVGRR